MPAVWTLKPADPETPAAESWKPLKLGGGGWITGIDIAPNGTMVARTDTFGAYIWNAGTSQWDQLCTAISIESVAGAYEIRVAPSDTTRLYMLNQGYFFSSSDSGLNWTRRTNFAQMPAADGNANDTHRYWGPKMAVDPNNADIVYVGTPHGGVRYTTDGGATWNQIATGTIAFCNTTDDSDATYPGHPGIAFYDSSHPGTPPVTQTIYVPSFGTGVYLTTNGGANWALLNSTGMPTKVCQGSCSSDGVYYCSNKNDQYTKSTWRYQSGAWTQIHSNDNDWVYVTAHPSTAGKVAILEHGNRLSVSTNYGSTWVDFYNNGTRVATDCPWLAWTAEGWMSIGNARWHPISGDFYIGEGIGVWKATLPATTDDFDWISQTNGIEQLVSETVVSPPGYKPVLSVADRKGFYVNDPDVYPSKHFPEPGAGDDPGTAISHGWAIDYASSDPSFVAAVFNGSGEDKSGYSSDLTHATWTAFANYPPAATSVGGSIAVSTPDNILWEIKGNTPPYYTKNATTTCTWAAVSLPSVTDWSSFHAQTWINRHIVCADRVSANTFYLFHCEDGSHAGIYRSTNSGDSWTRMFSGHGMVSGEAYQQTYWNCKLKSVPGNAGHLFYTSGDAGFGFARSVDGGATWTTLPDVGETQCFGFGKAVGAGYPIVYIYGSVSGVDGLYKSENADQASPTWTLIATAPNNSGDGVSCVSGDMNTYGKIYVGFGGSGFAYYG